MANKPNLTRVVFYLNKKQAAKAKSIARTFDLKNINRWASDVCKMELRKHL